MRQIVIDDGFPSQAPPAQSIITSTGVLPFANNTAFDDFITGLGGVVLAGFEYFNTTSGFLRVFNGATYDEIGAGLDGNAIHKNVAAEISTITEKVTPIGADLLLIEDSADANNKKRVQITNLPGGGGGAAPSVIHLHGGNGHGSTNLITRRYTSVRQNVGSDLTLAQDATNGDSITIDTSGRYLVIVYDRSTSAAGFIGASLNSVAIQQIQLLAIANQLVVNQVTSDKMGTCSGFYDLVATDVVRGHDDGNANSTDTSFVKLIVAGPF